MNFDASGTTPTTANLVSSAGLQARPAGQAKSLTVARDSSGDPEAFVIGIDGNVYAVRFNAGGTAVQRLGFLLAGGPDRRLQQAAAGGGGGPAARWDGAVGQSAGVDNRLVQ